MYARYARYARYIVTRWRRVENAREPGGSRSGMEGAPSVDGKESSARCDCLALFVGEDELVKTEVRKVFVSAV